MELLIVWENTFETGLNEIDNQHKKLVDLINQFYNALKLGKAKSELNDFFKQVTDYTEFHFQFEEDNFKKFNYENIRNHIRQHEKFKKEIENLKIRYLNNDFKVSFELMNLLRDWLFNHIVKSDKQYIDCFKENGIK